VQLKDRYFGWPAEKLKSLQSWLVQSERHLMMLLVALPFAKNTQVDIKIAEKPENFSVSTAI
jgi:hypothetical protein